MYPQVFKRGFSFSKSNRFMCTVENCKLNHKFIPLIDNTFEILIIKYFICSLLGQRNLASAKAITGKLVELYCCTLTTHLIIK